MKAKIFTLVAAVLFCGSLMFPNGIPLPTPPAPTPPTVTTPVVPADAAVATALRSATPADRARVVDIYTSFAKVVERDAGNALKTNEHISQLQERALIMAVETPGKYPGLDVAIDAAIARAFDGNLDVVALTPETRKNVITACWSIVAAAR